MPNSIIALHVPGSRHPDLSNSQGLHPKYLFSLGRRAPRASLGRLLPRLRGGRRRKNSEELSTQQRLTNPTPSFLSGKKRPCCIFLTPSASSTTKRSAHQLLITRARVVKARPKDFIELEDFTKIFVGGIPLQASTAEFIEYFSGFGKVKNFLLPPDPKNKKSNCGYGFINYKDPESVRNVLAQQHHILRAKEVSLTA